MVHVVPPVALLWFDQTLALDLRNRGPVLVNIHFGNGESQWTRQTIIMMGKMCKG